MRKNSDLVFAIGYLRQRNTIQSEIIAKMETYHRTLESADETDQHARTGISSHYSAAIAYLRTRREALDALINSVERYGTLTGFNTEGGVVFRLR